MEIKKNFGRAVVHYRNKLGISQEELATKSGLHRTYIGDIERGKRNLLASIPEAAYYWMRYFVMFDPAPLFPGIECPVLALNGEKDCQVLAEPNISAINKGLLNAGNPKTKTLILPGLNHLFQNCETGLLNEYGVIEETFDPETLKIISDWIRQ